MKQVTSYIGAFDFTAYAAFSALSFYSSSFYYVVADAPDTV